MERFHSKKSNHTLQYCVFDIIYYKGKKVTSLPLIERKELLMELNFNSNLVVPVQWMEGYGVQYFNLVKEMDLEGIVLKEKDSKYEINKRSNKWLKVINYKYTDVLITGILKKDQPFLLSSLEGNNQNIGVMEFVPIQDRKQIYKEIEKQGTTENDKVIYFKKGIPVNVKFRNWTSKGKLRIPSFNTWIGD